MNRFHCTLNKVHLNPSISDAHSEGIKEDRQTFSHLGGEVLLHLLMRRFIESVLHHFP